MSGFITVGYFLFSLLFSALIFLLCLRFALRYFRISALHPISQTILRITNPVVNPLHKFFQPHYLRANRYDWPCLIALIITEVVKFCLINLFFLHASFSIAFVIVHVLADLVIQPCNLLFYAIIFRVLISWVNPYLQNPITEVLYMCTEPVLQIARRSIPHFSGIDFSPFIILIILKIITLFISTSLASPFL